MVAGEDRGKASNMVLSGVHEKWSNRRKWKLLSEEVHRRETKEDFIPFEFHEWSKIPECHQALDH